MLFCWWAVRISKVASTLRPAVQVDEITDPHYFAALANQLHSIDIIEMVYTIAQLKLGIYRIFKITGNSLAGFDVAKVQAINTRTSRVEATLKVLVLDKKLIKIPIRPTQIRDDQEKVVSFTIAPFNVQPTRPDERHLETPGEYRLSTYQVKRCSDRRPLTQK